MLESSINFKTDDDFLQYICNNEDYVTLKVIEINERDRVRENARQVVEAFSRNQAERVASEIVRVTHFGFTRPDLYISARETILRRSEDYRKRPGADPIVGTWQAPENGV